MSDIKPYVKDFMSQRGLSIDQGATFKDALDMLISHKTNGLVVIDADKHVKGIISSWDLIKYLVPDYLENEEHLASFEASDVFVKRVKEIADDPISQFMTTDIHCARPEDTLMEAASLLAEHGIRQLPVVDQDNKLIGYLNRTDIKLAIGQVLDIFEK